MAIWDNQSEETKNKILEGLRAFAKSLKNEKRKQKIENVLRFLKESEKFTIEITHIKKY